MEVIKLLPHHARSLFEVYYLGRSPEGVVSWYENPTMKQNGVARINQIVSSPDQLVQIVDTYDEFCRMCPKNKRGNNYVGSEVCRADDSGHFYDSFANVLGLREVLDGDP